MTKLFKINHINFKMEFGVELGNIFNECLRHIVFSLSDGHKAAVSEADSTCAALKGAVLSTTW